MNKTDIVAHVKQLALALAIPVTDVVISAGGAMVMLGLRETTVDLDVDVPNETFEKLKTQYPTGKFNNVEYVHFSDNVDLHRLAHKECMCVHGVTTYSLEQLIAQKENLARCMERNPNKRQQDKRDLVALNALCLSGW